MAKRIERMGRWIKADEAFEAWTSADLGRMLAARSVHTNSIDRHFLLQGIVKETYRRRSEPRMRKLCIETGLIHLSEFPAIGPALRADCGGNLPRVASFMWLSTVLAEEGRFDDAVRICETAAELGMKDGTKGGYAGRARRIAKKKLVAGQQEQQGRAPVRGKRSSTGCVLLLGTMGTVLATVLWLCT